MTLAGLTVALGVLAAGINQAPLRAADGSVARAAARCSDYPNQKTAQEAADTRDADGDGIDCEDLPCPCSNAAGGRDDQASESCTKPPAVQRLVFSKSKYPNIRKHSRIALRRG